MWSQIPHPAIRPEVDAEGLAEVFVMGPGRTPGHGIFRGVAELKPGHSLVYDRKGIHIQRYWSLESRPHEDDLDTTAAKVRELFQDTVERQLVADVPVCTLLSGGLDSSAITAFAAEALRKTGHDPIHTYSIEYKDNDRYFQSNEFQPDSDGPWVKRFSQFLGTQHHYVTIDTPQLVDTLSEAVRARDLPGMADIVSSLYLFSREIKKGATVALSGECADEVFGGYPWLRRQEALEAQTFPWSLKLKQRINLLSSNLIQLIKPEEYIKQRYEEALAEVPALHGDDPYEARIRQINYLNLTRWMPILLDRKDRMSMAVGLEIRVPFCDHRLVEYAWNIPWAMKSCDGKAKGILRRALVGILPEDVLARPKNPYPKTHNPAYLSAVRTWVLDILDDPGSPLLSLINTKAVRQLAGSREDFDIPWFGQLMRLPQLFAYLVQVDIWLRRYSVSIC